MDAARLISHVVGGGLHDERGEDDDEEMSSPDDDGDGVGEWEKGVGDGGGEEESYHAHPAHVHQYLPRTPTPEYEHDPQYTYDDSPYYVHPDSPQLEGREQVRYTDEEAIMQVDQIVGARHKLEIEPLGALARSGYDYLGPEAGDENHSSPTTVTMAMRRPVSEQEYEAVLQRRYEQACGESFLLYLDE